MSLFVGVQTPLTWPERMKILRGTACGLAYLHGSKPPYIHRDIKRCVVLSAVCSHSYIMLTAKTDEGKRPKVAFFMALPVQHGSSCLVTGGGALTITGIRGYVAPEFSRGKLGTQSDVYSYGMVGFRYLG